MNLASKVYPFLSIKAARLALNKSSAYRTDCFLCPVRAAYVSPVEESCKASTNLSTCSLSGPPARVAVAILYEIESDVCILGTVYGLNLLRLYGAYCVEQCPQATPGSQLELGVACYNTIRLMTRSELASLTPSLHLYLNT